MTIIVSSVLCINNIYCFNLGKIVNIPLTDQLDRLVDTGVGELLVYSVDKDGTMSGGDVRLAKTANDQVNIPVIYAGGISSAEDAANLVLISDISGVGISSVFHFTSTTPNEVSREMSMLGLPTRI